MTQLNSHQFKDVYKSLGIDLDQLGCVMADVEVDEDMKLLEGEPMSKLYHSRHPARRWISGWVLDHVAHVTLLYGLLTNAHKLSSQIEAVLKGWQMDTIEIGDIGYFESPYHEEKYYCIIAHIKVTPELMEGHERLELLPHINTFTGYKPHMTICYIKKDEELRDRMIAYYKQKWIGRKLKIVPAPNLGYPPKETHE